MSILIDSTLLPPVIQYAETHYRFSFVPSLLWKPEPEIIADAPSLVVPQQPVPILLLVKDAHEFPIRFDRVRVRVRQGDRTLFDHEQLPLQGEIRSRLWWTVLELPHPGVTGWVDIDVEFRITAGTGTRVYRNDNYRTTGHRPLRTYLAAQALPGSTLASYGDAHTHSSFTDDQVEFGSPLEASVPLARAMGLTFFAATDHSYDLDDCADDCLHNDPALPKWRQFHADIDGINSKDGSFVILRGEEVTCRTGAGRNVHLLLYGNRTFVPGSGDGAERWLRTRSEHTVTEAIQLAGEEAAAFAAHPFEPVPVLQRLLLGRGAWKDPDLRSACLSGIQIANGSLGLMPDRSVQQWVRLLLSGHRLVVLGGNDAHGNFNRFRQIRIPVVCLRERNAQLFGRVKTGIVTAERVNEEVLQRCLRGGRSFVTDGPFCLLEVHTADGRTYPMGSIVRRGNAVLRAQIRSTPDFGSLHLLRIWEGTLGHASERLLREVWYGGQQEAEVRLEYEPVSAAYVRLELQTSSDNPLSGKPHAALSNPIWFEP